MRNVFFMTSDSSVKLVQKIEQYFPLNSNSVFLPLILPDVYNYREKFHIEKNMVFLVNLRFPLYE